MQFEASNHNIFILVSSFYTVLYFCGKNQSKLTTITYTYNCEKSIKNVGLASLRGCSQQPCYFCVGKQFLKKLRKNRYVKYVILKKNVFLRGKLK